MHSLFSQASGMTHDVIGAAIEVHKDKGPGLVEPIYEWCLTMELELRGHLVQNQDHVIIRYKQFQRKDPLRFDLLIDKCLFVEVKAVETVHPIHKAQLLSYMKLLDIPLGLPFAYTGGQLQCAQVDRWFVEVNPSGRQLGVRERSRRRPQST